MLPRLVPSGPRLTGRRPFKHRPRVDGGGGPTVEYRGGGVCCSGAPPVTDAGSGTLSRKLRTSKGSSHSPLNQLESDHHTTVDEDIRAETRCAPCALRSPPKAGPSPGCRRHRPVRSRLLCRRPRPALKRAHRREDPSVRTLARRCNWSSTRAFTPDLMPGDCHRIAGVRRPHRLVRVPVGTSVSPL